MLFLLFGSSGSGKTYVLDHLRARVERVEVYDFDDLGVPPRPDIAWRRRATEAWVVRALELEEAGLDMLLAGQVPLGELLAAPSAPRLTAIAACLLDCDDVTRRTRLEARGPEWFEQAGGTVERYLAWAEWLRGHARDPRHRLEVIAGDGGLAVDRFSGWEAGDARWQVPIVQTNRPRELVVGEIVAWIAGQRRLLAAGRHPLAGWAETVRHPPARQSTPPTLTS
jgi:hypothetical protein